MAPSSHTTARNTSRAAVMRSKYVVNALTGSTALGSITIGKYLKMPKRKRRPDEMEGLSVKAVVPAGGIGTRLRPFTLTMPKELLPVARKPMVQVAVEEALASGITEIGIVIPFGSGGAGFNINAKYNYAFKTSDTKEQSWISLGVGLSYIF